jgi:hypothetical protein
MLVAHLDCVPLAQWQGVEVEDVEVAADDGDAEVAEDAVHVYAEHQERRHKKKHKKREAVRDAHNGVDVRPVRHCFR